MYVGIFPNREEAYTNQIDLCKCTTNYADFDLKHIQFIDVLFKQIEQCESQAN